MKPVNFASALLASVSTLAVASMADAQTAAPAAPSSTSEIVVTGSRVIQNGNNSPTPLTVVSTDQLTALQPTTISDALNNLPEFQGSRGAMSTPGTTGNYGGGNPATVALNLRNLTPQRTLVLFDGQRIAPSNALGVVDTDTIPQELIQRVDIVTGGVSAVYGSDAIAGVVNFVVDRNFNGIKLDANAGISQRHDDPEWKASIAAGHPLFDGKGHIEFSFDHYDNQGLPHRSERGYDPCSLLGTTVGAASITLGTAANPYKDFCNVRNAQSPFGGLISNGALKGDVFDTNGVLTPFVHGTLTGTANSEIGGDGATTGYQSLIASSLMNQVYGRFDYDVSNEIHFHANVALTWKTATTYSNPSALNNLTFSSTNAFLPAAYQSAMGTATTFTMSKTYSNIPGLQQTANVESHIFNAGFDGRLSKYNWAVDVSYNNNSIDDVFYNNINLQRLYAALDAVNSNGQIVCQASLSNSAYSNCVPFNAFGPTAASAAAIAYVTSTTHFTPKFDQLELNGHIGGDLFDLPAGPVKGDVSFEYRKLGFSQGTDAAPSQTQVCTGIRYNCSATTATYSNAFGPGPWVYQNVKEGAFETDIPLLKDKPFFQDVSLNGAVRYTSYDFGGSNWTYKVGLDWHVNDEVTIRATQSQDIEAPTMGMLFQPPLTVLAQDLDYLTGVTQQANQLGIGNPNLVSEVGHTTTAGIVWRPAFIPGFSMSFDAYHTIIDNALTQVQGQTSYVQQICYASGGTSPYCATIVRPFALSNTTAANTATTYFNTFINIASIETYGADLEVNYARRIWDKPFNTRFFLNWQPHYLFAQPGVAKVDFAGITFPNVVPLQDIPAVQFTWMTNIGITDNFFVGVIEKGRTAMALEPSGAGVFLTPGAGAYAITTVDFTYRFKPGNEIYFDVRNLFDRLGQQVKGLSQSVGAPYSDDVVGRYFTVGLRAKF